MHAPTNACSKHREECLEQGFVLLLTAFYKAPCRGDSDDDESHKRIDASKGKEKEDDADLFG